VFLARSVPERPRPDGAFGRTLWIVGRSGVEPLWPARLRWRMRGAWLWPTYLVLTPLAAVVLTRLPFYGSDGPGSFPGALLLAGFANLAIVAGIAPLVARRLRRRRSDLPRIVAHDTAGTRLLIAAFLALVVGGLVHRPVVAEAERDAAAQASALHDYVNAQAPEYREGLAVADAIRIEEDLYRSCVPGPDPQQWLCLIIQTDQSPAGIRVDGDRAPNSVYRLHGGFD
jgi:hypothetical protein